MAYGMWIEEDIGMITLQRGPVFLDKDGKQTTTNGLDREAARQNTMAWQILAAHNQGSSLDPLKLKFDALVSPDNNYVSILQTARASGLKKFPVPYVLSNCHNTLCGVGGTINEDDHRFGLDNARKYGGIFVPRYRAILHQYMRECMAGGGKMILGSDSHTRYGALGTMGIGEGGGEIAKQLLGQTYDVARPDVIAVVLTGSPQPGVGPMDVALTLIGAVFKKGFVKNRVLEFLGDGIGNLSVEYRMGIDVMTTESGALSSIWRTDDKVRQWLALHGREQDYKEIVPGNVACYDGVIRIDLSTVECMMALPFHPSNAVSIREFKADPEKYLAAVEVEGTKIKGAPFSLQTKLHAGELYIDQATVSGCSGGMYDNMAAMADILEGCELSGDGPFLGINPASQPVNLAMMKNGISATLTQAGAIIRPSMCGPCFGVTDVPADGQLSIRHVTRNYPNREGSKPREGQMAAAILMDARSIAATVRNGGRLTAATELHVAYKEHPYTFAKEIYEGQVVNDWGKAEPETELRMGPNIAPWPDMEAYRKHLVLKIAGMYPGTLTTDELLPSGEATAYRANPNKISEYTLQSRDPEYRARSKAIRSAEQQLRQGKALEDGSLEAILSKVCEALQCSREDLLLGSMIAGENVGDGSSREQAVSNQKVLGGFANLAETYATKRYRSNLINWGLLPMIVKKLPALKVGDVLVVPNVREAIAKSDAPFTVQVLGGETFEATLGKLTEEEKQILASGCLINYYKK